MRPSPQIVAFGGGGFSMEAGNPLLDDYVLALSGTARPRVCFLATASGDADHYIVRFYRRFAPDCEASHVSLFRRDREGIGVDGDIAAHLLAQDVVYVGGGNVVSLLGTWRAHGLDAILAEAWHRGVVLCGPSAGSLCWFAEALSAFQGAPRRVSGLGLLPFSNCVHYDGEPVRRTEYRRFVGDGMAAVRRMPALTPTDSMIVAGGRPGTPGAAAPSPVRPPLRRAPPPQPARSRREAERGLGGPSSSEPPSYPRLR